jgi:hypothetical protein
VEPHDISNHPPQQTLPQQQTLPTPPSAPSPPQLWLGPGPYLARRTWQQKTRTLITALTGLSGVLWIIVAFLAIALGALVTAAAKDDTFDGKGEVTVSCSTGDAADGAVVPGTKVVAWTDNSDDVLHTTLGQVEKVTEKNKGSKMKTVRCHLPFTLPGVRRDAAGYNIRIGDTATQFLTSRALKDGAIVPIVIGGDR